MTRSREEILNGMSFPEFNDRCKLSFRFFVENMLGVNTLGGVQTYQEEWVKKVKEHRFLIIEAATGHAKTTVLGVWHTLWWCWKNKNQEILVLSVNFEQSKNTFRNIRTAIEDNPILTEIFGNEKSAKVWNEKMIKTKAGNNNQITVLPYGSTRGYRAHLIYADEVDVWEDTDVYFEDVVSRLHPEGHIVLTSTPKNNTNLLYQIRKIDINHRYHWMKTPAITRMDGSHFDVTNFCEEDLNHAKPAWPESFSMEEIRLKWDTQSKFKFISQQLVTILGESENTPFPIKNLYECYNNKLAFSFAVHDDASYFIGADFANSDGDKADYTVYTVVEIRGKVLTLKYIQKLNKGSKTPMKVELMKILYDKFNTYGTCRIVADMTNIGTEIIPEMRMAGMSVIEQPFQWRLRRELIQTCSNIIQTGTEYVRIPKRNGPEYINEQKLIDEMQGQLAGFQLVKSDAGNENYKSKAPHDDIAISFMMALKEANKMILNNVKAVIYKKGQEYKNQVDLIIPEENEVIKIPKEFHESMLETKFPKQNPNSLVRLIPIQRNNRFR